MLQDLADTVEVEEVQAILAFRTEAKALEEVGDSSQEEAHQEGQEEDPTATAEVDQAGPWSWTTYRPATRTTAGPCSGNQS